MAKPDLQRVSLKAVSYHVSVQIGVLQKLLEHFSINNNKEIHRF